ncbi:MAG: DUF1648 domain-containing protein, partial [Planctomycetes bacterium]|nr:DUF1648 domain-containing protein [Planctomycetota bacterium]
MNEQTRRSITGAVLPVLALAITLLAILDTDSLPDPMASHWDLSGDPNDSIGRTTFFGLFFALVFVTGLTSLWASRRRDVRRGDLTPPVALATFMQWTFVGVVVAATHPLLIRSRPAVVPVCETQRLRSGRRRGGGATPSSSAD